MKHFKNIQSLESLKDQYRKLALANHPDRGGDTKIMQEINLEYEALFPIWKDRTQDTSQETAQSTRSEFYTQNGWKGENYNINLTTSEIAQIIRQFVKEKYPTYKFSITVPHCSSLHISLMEAPQDVFIQDNLNEYEKRDLQMQVNQYNIENNIRLTELCREILKDIKTFVHSYKFDDSDVMRDYFNTNFYLSLSIGKWDKPFKIVPGTARVKGQDKAPVK